MNLDREIDRILREERTLTPSPDFTSRVMRSVRQEADRNEGIAFPWVLLAVGLGACALMVLVAFAAGLFDGAPRVVPVAVARAMQRPEVAMAVTWVPVMLSGIYLVSWWSLRLARTRG